MKTYIEIESGDQSGDYETRNSCGYGASALALNAMPTFRLLNPLVAELFCHKLDLLEIVGFLCTFLQHAVC